MFMLCLNEGKFLKDGIMFFFLVLEVKIDNKFLYNESVGFSVWVFDVGKSIKNSFFILWFQKICFVFNKLKYEYEKMILDYFVKFYFDFYISNDYSVLVIQSSGLFRSFSCGFEKFVRNEKLVVKIDEFNRIVFRIDRYCYVIQ